MTNNDYSTNADSTNTKKRGLFLERREFERPAPCTKEENAELIQLYRSGDDIARERAGKRLIEGNSGIVYQTARGLHPQSEHELEDYVQIGYQCLLTAFETWDPELGTLTTYLKPFLRSKMGRVYMTGVPEGIHISLDTPLSGESTLSVGETLGDERDVVGDRAELQDQKQRIAGIMSALTERERNILEWRYVRDYTFVEIGNILGCSKTAVTNQTEAALKKARSYGLRRHAA